MAARGALADRRAADRTPADRAARVVSYALNPLVFPAIGFPLLDAHFGAPPAEVARTLGVSAVFFCLVPLGYVVAMVLRGGAESLEVRDRAARLRPMLLGIASYAVGALVLWQTVGGAARPVIVAFSALFPLNTAGLLLITRRWKISLHAAGLAGLVAVLGFTALAAWPALPPGPPLLTPARVAAVAAFLPLLMWARVHSRAHTVAQVVAGAAYGLLLPAAELYAVVVLWLGLAG